VPPAYSQHVDGRMGKWPRRSTPRALSRASRRQAAAKGSLDSASAKVVLKRSCSFSRRSNKSDACIRLGSLSSQSDKTRVATRPEKAQGVQGWMMLTASSRSAKMVSKAMSPAAARTRPACLISRLTLQRWRTNRSLLSNALAI